MKKFTVIAGLLLIFFALNACSSSIPAIQYDGKERPISEVEEIIADKLEVENPDLDLEVQINQESDNE